jgi:hypothetical protein
MNNGACIATTCVGVSCSSFAWVSDSTVASGAWIQLTWPAPVLIGSFYIVTENGQAPACGPPNGTVQTGRNLAGGTVQTWNGQTWVTAGSFSGQIGNVQFNLPSPVSTTMLRIFNTVSSPGVGMNSIIHQWHVYSGTNCLPPP